MKKPRWFIIERDNRSKTVESLNRFARKNVSEFAEKDIKKSIEIKTIDQDR